MNEDKWKLGLGQTTSDSVMDGFTFDDLITAIQSNCKEITEDDVWEQAMSIIRGQMEDMKYLIETNMEQIINAAFAGREERA